jgi:hypothetical protein
MQLVRFLGNQHCGLMTQVGFITCVTRETKSVAVTFEPRNLMHAKKSFPR